MTRRATWVTVAAIAAVVIVAGAVWAFQPRDDASDGPARAAHSGAPTSDDETGRAQQRWDALLAACTSPADAVPPSCGLRIPWAADLVTIDSVRFRIEQPPQLTLTPPTFRAEGGILVATVTGTGHDGAAKSVTYRTEDWMLRGDVDITRKGVDLIPW